MSTPAKPLYERLLARLKPRGDLGCWEWTGAINNWNYGTYTQREPGRATPARRYVHRAIEQIYRDAEAQRLADEVWPDPWTLPPITRAPPLDPDSETIDHTCCFRRCGNPDHWTVITRAEHGAVTRAREKLTKTSDATTIGSHEKRTQSRSAEPRVEVGPSEGLCARNA